MATYKVIQDIEAEDHILGPLTLRQFIYGLVSVFFFYLSFVSVAKHAAYLLIILLPFALFTTFFTFPFGRDQPTEVWALAKIRYFLLPRKRIWNQSGAKEIVTITVPKKSEVVLTNQLSQTEVKDRLEALASTIDSRGWVVKNMVPGSMNGNDSNDGDDRLINVGSIPRPVPDFDTAINSDIFDDNSQVSMQVNSLIQQSTIDHRQQIMTSMQQSGTQQPIADPPQPISEDMLSEQLKQRNSNSMLSMSSLHTISTTPPTTPPRRVPSPVTTKPKQAPPIVDTVNTSTVAKKPQTERVDPAILNLARNNDLNIATIQHEANKAINNDEVVINLH